MNQNGTAAIPFYGFISALAADPIEKKPLYHYRPGSSILSLGFAGCNLRCPFCQNWHISQAAAADIPGRVLTPEAMTALAGEHRCNQIAYTYSEPRVHIDYLLDCMALCRKAGIANVLVSNGCINDAPAAEILALTDAANIDLKCFSEETYANVLGGDLHTVLGFLESAAETGVHLEVTTLIVPGLNDSEAELDTCAAFIAGLSDISPPENRGTSRREIPWHLSAYHPAYQWEAPPTDPGSLLKAARRAGEILPLVYTGNVALTDRGSGGSRFNERKFKDTHCPFCGAVLVSRRGYQVDTAGLVLKEGGGGLRYHCAHCGEAAPIRY
jgi:pyruvate formate lyase activating enzyme